MIDACQERRRQADDRATACTSTSANLIGGGSPARRVGEPRYFSSVFSMQVTEGNVADEPTDQAPGRSTTSASTASTPPATCSAPSRPRCSRWPPARSATTGSSRPTSRSRLPSDSRVNAIATFTVSFGAADVGTLHLVGTKGSLRLDPAYEYAMPMVLETRVGEKVQKRRFGKRDQIAADLEHLAGCSAPRRGDPEPSGWEGLHDVRIIRAILSRRAEGESLGRSARQAGPAGPPAGERTSTRAKVASRWLTPTRPRTAAGEAGQPTHVAEAIRGRCKWGDVVAEGAGGRSRAAAIPRPSGDRRVRSDCAGAGADLHLAGPARTNTR